MKKKVVWLVVTCWMVAALLLASCAPAVVKEEEEKVAPPVKEEEVVVPKEVVVPEEEANMVKWTGAKLDGTVVEKMIEKPRYGGVLTASLATQPTGWDDNVYGVIVGNASLNPVCEELLTRDVLRGSGGTGEWSGHLNMFIAPHEVGCLATGWEIPDDSTAVFHIRQGVHWALDPTSEASRLMGGRELTADDVVHHSRNNWDHGYARTRAAYLSDMKNVKNSIYVSPTDKWAMVIKCQPGMVGLAWETAADVNQIHPPEVVEKYGNMNDWKRVVGTGPFMLKDYVGASSITYVRNPNYWGYDPFFPENQLPYIDTFKALIIPDMSTQMAGLRTGQIDFIYDVTAEDCESLLKTNPELKWEDYLSMGSWNLMMRVNEPELPFYDVRVRQALYMAIDIPAILNDYYGGKACLDSYPIMPIPEWANVYTPMEDMPEIVREMHEYHPDKAKQLLAEAGYPNGFKTEVLCYSTSEQIDLLSVIKEYWAEIGVDLKIDVRDYAVWNSAKGKKQYQILMRNITSANPFLRTYERAGHIDNQSMVNDPRVEEALVAMNLAYFDWDKKCQIAKDLVPYIKEQAWHITLPAGYGYALWKPWLKNFHGVRVGGYLDSLKYPKYVWIDQELKKAMGR